MRIVAGDMLDHLLQQADRDVEVFCDGIRCKKVVSADEERGEVVYWPDLDREEPLTIRGTVRIEIIRKGER